MLDIKFIIWYMISKKIKVFFDKSKKKKLKVVINLYLKK
jgi:hypothetical protein